MGKSVSAGYTLSEILIALAILGVCMSVAMPMMAQSRDQAARRAILKEVVVSLYQAMREGMLTDTVYMDNAATYFSQKMNAVKTCPVSARTEGCWNPPVIPYQFQNQQVASRDAGFVLASGAVVMGFNNLPWKQVGPGCETGQECIYEFITVDANGEKVPNELGKDQLVITLNMGNYKVDLANYDPTKGRYIVKSGTIALYESLNLIDADGTNYPIYGNMTQYNDSIKLWQEISK
jgi:prepilin-type N-terminal cleavage/methylation domain-containing protein